MITDAFKSFCFALFMVELYLPLCFIDNLRTAPDIQIDLNCRVDGLALLNTFCVKTVSKYLNNGSFVN